jgi:hypothetical protein
MQRGLTWCSLLICGSLLANPVLKNPGFEEGAALPKGWGKAIHGEKFVLRRDATGGRDGTACAYLEGQKGHGDRACFLQTSAPFAPNKGLRVRFWYRGEGRAVGLLRVRPAPGVKVPGKEYGTRHFSIQTPKDEWTEYAFEIGMPKAAQAAERVRAEVILYQRGDGVVRYDDVSMESLDTYQPRLNTVAPLGICPRRPDDGRTVLQNPPDFWWPPQGSAATYALQLAQSAEFVAADTTTIMDLKYNVYSHAQTLKPGTWFWRVRFANEDGAASGWTKTWRFVVPANATPFPVPSAATMLERIPVSHPRVYATAESLAAFRAPMQTTRKAWWDSFTRRLEGFLKRETMREPGEEFANYRKGGLTDTSVKLGQKLRGNCARATGRMQELAFGYLLSGDAKYATAAIDQAVEMAGWDPAGVTSYHNHDQVFRDIAWKLATTYDWCHDRMTEEQRSKVRAAVLARGAVLFRDFTDGRTIYEYPFDSHGITAYGFLGVCAIALAHDEPVADEWFRFIAATYPAINPPWGGEEGGWAQGTAYWKWSQPFAWWFFDALKSSTGVDLYQKAFNHNNGWFKLYMHPPWSDRHHFGDGNHGAPGTADASNIARFAKVYGNPYFQWYADEIPWRPGGIFSYWWYDQELAARPPADLPPGRHFADIGWVGMHSDVSDPDSVFLAFKSSPYGSFNHSHADQNSFVLYAYGEPLLIDSGYYDWYGSPHDKGWTRQTKAHNAVLVNGQGQSIFDLSAKGQIDRHFTSPVADMTAGDATVAYKGALKQARRTIFYLRPDLFVVVDDLEAPEPAEFTWSVHAEREMTLRPDTGEILVERGVAQCLVKFLEPAGLVLAQTDQFDPPPTTPRPNEWHATAATKTKATHQRFVTLVMPFRRGASEPQLTWDGSRLTRKGETATDELNLDFTGGVPSLIAKGTRPTGGYSFRSTPTGNVAMKFENAGGKQQPTGVWRDTDQRRETVHGGVDLVLGQGQREWHNQASAAPPQVNLSMTLDGQMLPWRFESMRTFDDGVLTWLKLPEDAPGGVKVELTADETTVVRFDRRRLRSGEMVWLLPGSRLSIRSIGNPLSAGIAFRSLVKDATPSVAEIIDLPQAARKIEAEDRTDSGGGNAKVYSHRTFLSGGKGLETAVRAGQWTEWTFTSKRQERLALVLKAAVFEGDAQRLVELDGQPLGGSYRVYQLPNTGGFGALPEQWKHLRLAEFSVPAGEHTLRLSTIARKANLDYLMLVPVP